MKNQKGKPKTPKTHEGEGGRLFQEHGKGHDLLNSNSSTDGVGSEVKSPADAKVRELK